MCGITGFIGKGGVDDLEKMISALHHRGPNDKGLFFESGVGLGHTRLSIIDLTPSGHQPMFSSDKKVGIVFNGEIYNFQDLKNDLIKEGFLFKGTSDTEVIIYLYQKYGEECFRKMNGMFAIAIYDFEKNKLILSRDRLGKKPLYWGIFDNTLIFASELKSFIKHPLCKKEIDLASLNLYLQLDYVPTPRTIFKNIYKLEPGSYLIYKESKIDKKYFWHLNYKASNVSFEEALDRLDVLLNESVKSRLVSDVPVGIFLSGGLDSSTVAYYAQKNSKEKIHTFSIGFSEKSFDESDYAIQVSKYLGTEHHHMNLSAKDSLDLIPHIAEILDEPMADASIIPTYLLSKFTKENVTVALGGDGGDELFAGYPTFQADKFVSLYTLLPKFIRNFIKYLVNKIPVSEKNFSLGFKLRKFINGLNSDRFLMHQRWLGTFDEKDLNKLLKNNTGSNLLEKLVGDIKHNIKSDNQENSLLLSYMKTYMMDEVLVKVDRASMKASLETRSPFLDYKLVEFVNSLPYSYKLKGFKTKYILKLLMLNKLPKSIIFRPKKGFGIPLARWLKFDLRPVVDHFLSESMVKNMGLFNWDIVSDILDDHYSSKSDNRKQIWNLLVFSMWWSRWMDK